MDNPVLSVIIISHNQKEELIRCVNSVLDQNIPFEYEIIISDDSSVDGTYEAAVALGTKYAHIHVYRCNSDDCNPPTSSQRSGYNRCNAYQHIKGKYFAHVDADDYFRSGSRVYERQVAALENHPECSLAMSNFIWLEESKHGECGEPGRFPREMSDGEIISQNEFITQDFFRINQCFLQRKIEDVDPTELYGYRYVDAIITYHHLQYGRVVYVDACDYVYVIHPKSIGVSTYESGSDVTVLWCLGLYIPFFIPIWSRQFFMGFYYDNIRRVINLAKSKYKMLPKNFDGIRGLDCWIYGCFNRNLTSFDMLRLTVTEFWMRMMKKTKLQGNYTTRILRKLLIG